MTGEGGAAQSMLNYSAHPSLPEASAVRAGDVMVVVHDLLRRIECTAEPVLPLRPRTYARGYVLPPTLGRG